MLTYLPLSKQTGVFTDSVFGEIGPVGGVCQWSAVCPVPRKRATPVARSPISRGRPVAFEAKMAALRKARSQGSGEDTE